MFSGLVRCPKCGGKTVGKRQWHAEYNYQETRRYICRAYHNNGSTACSGWSAYEQTVKKGAVAFLVDLLDNKLHWRAHLEDAAREIQRDSAGERLQHLQANIAQAQHDLNKVQKGFIQGIFTAEESPHRNMDAREKVERAEKAIKDLEEAGDIKTELDAAMAALDVPMEQFLNELPNSGLAQLCRAVFQHFVVKRPEWRSAGPP